MSTDNYQIAFVVLLGRVLGGQCCCCLENVCIWKPFLGSVARSLSKQHGRVRTLCLLEKQGSLFCKTALFLCWQIGCLLIVVVFLSCLAKCMPYQERAFTSSGIFN